MFTFEAYNQYNFSLQRINATVQLSYVGLRYSSVFGLSCLLGLVFLTVSKNVPWTLGA
jgi:hypothetical protein